MSHTLTAARPAFSTTARRGGCEGAGAHTRASLPSGRSRPSGPTRLTLRGRLVLVALLAAAGFGVVSLGQVATDAIAADPSVPASSVPTTEWVVQPGETLWQIAESVAPEADPRDTVARIEQLNDLPTSSVLAGQTLLVPA
jgi:nucleoid-associated protein YgaU